MLPFIVIGNFQLPVYGMLLIIGAVIGNVFAFRRLKTVNISVDDFIVIEGYGLLGAIIGAKGLYLFVARDIIDWSRFFEAGYFASVMTGGFVFYGGLILAVLFALLGGKIHKIDTVGIMKEIIFCVPFAHAFGRLGCFFAGCCYGMEYDGLFSVTFRHSDYAPNNIPLFPSQLLEAFLLLLLSLFLYLYIRNAGKKKKANHSIIIYFAAYAVIRFFIEFLRGDNAERGNFAGLSTSQWICIIIMATMIILFTAKRKE